MDKKQGNRTLKGVTLAAILAFSLIALGGILEPAAGPGGTMHTLSEIYGAVKSLAGGEPFVSDIPRNSINCYMRIPGVPGEATSDGHADWIELLSVSQSHAVPRGSDGGVVGPVKFEDITVVKVIDKASPKIAEAVCDGRMFDKVDIDFTSSYSGSDRIPYFQWELTNARVTSYNISGAGQSESIPTEEVTLNFEAIKVIYTEQKPDGSAKGQHQYSWIVNTLPQ